MKPVLLSFAPVLFVVAAPAFGQLSLFAGDGPPGMAAGLRDISTPVRTNSVKASPEQIDRLIADLGVGTGLVGSCTPRRTKGDRAAIELLKIGPSAVASLSRAVRAVDGPDAETGEASNRRWFAVQILGRIGSRRATPALDYCLRHDPSAAVRTRAARALGDLKDPDGEPVLILTLKDPYPDVQAAAARALGVVGSANSVPALVALLGSPERPQSFRSVGRRLAGPLSPAESASQALAKIGTPALPALRASLESSDTRTRHFGALGLAASTSPLALEDRRTLLHHSEPDVRTAAVRGEMAHHDPAAVPVLVDLLRDPAPPPQQSYPSISALAGMALAEAGGLPGVKALLAAAHGSDPVAAGAATEGLRDVWSPEANDLLLEEVERGKGEVRLSAAQSLVHCPDRRTAGALLGLASDKDPIVREYAVFLLNQVRDSRVFPALVKATRDSNERVRIAATEFLSGRKSDPIVPPLLQRLSDTVEAVRLYAVYGLGSKGDRAAIPALEALRTHDTLRVRQAARKAIDIIEGKARGWY